MANKFLQTKSKLPDQKEKNKALTQKVSSQEFALPVINKKNSISEIDMKNQHQRSQQSSILSQVVLQNDLTHHQSPPYLSSSNPKMRTTQQLNQEQSISSKLIGASNKTYQLSPRVLDKISPFTHIKNDILEKEELAEYSKSEDNNLSQEMEISPLNLEKDEQNMPSYRNIIIENKKKEHKANTTKQDDLRQTYNLTRNNFNDRVQKMVRDYNEKLDVSARSRKSQNNLMNDSKNIKTDASQNIQKNTSKKNVVQLQNTQEILLQNQFNPTNENNAQITATKMKQKPAKKIDKVALKQQQKDADMKKYFQANINAQIQFAGTEFSTPGSSSKFLEEYQLEDKSLLGAGGYAEVRLATHKKTGLQVAIKIYEKYKLIDPQVKQNLIREIKILSRLNHPNIMKLFESIDTLSHVYLINEYVKGLPLNDYIKSMDPQKLEEIDALNILRQILDSLTYLHQKNMCHRDIKLENIIIDPQTKIIKIIDFGFAVYSTKNLKLYCGTPTYMAPEIIQKKEYKGPPIDIWTCGIAFYIMLCGYFPFYAHTDRELSRKIQQGIFHIPKELSEQSINLLQQMLQVDPHQRASASTLLEEINSLKQNQLASIDNAERQQDSKVKLNHQLSQKIIDFERHLDNGRGPANKRNKTNLSPRAKTQFQSDLQNLDNDTLQHLIKLGYSEIDIKQNFNKETEMIGILYKRLLTLKSSNVLV